MTATLKAHPIWNDVSQALAQVDSISIAEQHLKDCDYRIEGYWDEKDQFYELVQFFHRPRLRLLSCSFGVTEGQSNRLWLRFVLEVETATADFEEVGELTLLLNDELKVMDENWAVDVKSPFVSATLPGY